MNTPANPQQQRQRQQQHCSSDDVERGAATTTTRSSSSGSSRRGNMKVQDRIQAMNRVIEQDEFLGPMEMMTNGDKSPGSHPKRSSVVEMWKRREGAIKKASSSSYNNKFEEKKEAYPNEEEDIVVVDDFQRQVGSGDSELDARQHDKTTAAINSLWSSSTTTATAAAAAMGPQIVTPERSGPESDDSSSNFESSVRRSNIRDSWKKRSPHIASYGPPHKATAADLSLDASADSVSGSPAAEDEPLNNAGLYSDASENDISTHAVPSSPSPPRISWRKTEESKLPKAPETLRSKASARSPIDRSRGCDPGAGGNPSTGSTPSAFDELRSKWAKFGVQQEQAGAAGRVRPLPVATQTPNVASSGAFQKVPKTPERAREEVPPYAPSSPVTKRLFTGEEVFTDPPAPSKVAEDGPQPGGRKSQLVRMGQMHVSRPKADVSSGPKSPVKRYAPSKHSPKSSGPGTLPRKSPDGKSGPVTQSDLPLKRSALQKSAEVKSLLRAKQRRRAQQAQSVSAAAVPRHRSVNDALSSTGTNKTHDSSEDSFPLDETAPDHFGSQFRNAGGDAMVESSLPMRTLFGSQSDESLELGPSIEKDHSYFPDPRHITKTEVMKTTFDSWSEIESFSAEGPNDALNDSGSGKPHPFSSHLTNSALKRLREKRQKHVPQKSVGSGRRRTVELHEQVTPERDFGSYQHERAKDIHPPSSPDASSAVSQSVGSDTTYSNSHMQSTYDSGNTKETATPTGGRKSNFRSTLKDVVPDAKEMIPDEFVSEKNASVQSFRTAYESLSLEQIARDIKDEASSVLSMDFLNNELLNKSMHAAGASLNKLVAGEMFRKQNQRRLVQRATSPVEEVAIEVEYIADSEDER